MNSRDEIICRLCLKMPTSDFKVVDEVTQEILGSILLKVNLAVSEDPIICKNCAESLQKSYGFKTACMSAEDCLIFFDVAKSGAILDLKEVYLCESTNINTAADADSGVCRFCLQHVKKGCCTPLDTLEKAMGIVSDMLPKYLPEINLRFTKEPIICTPCLASLESHFSFAMVCWRVEEQIRKFLEIEGTNDNGKVKLRDVLQFILINTLDDEEFSQADDVRKEGNLFISRGDEGEKVSEDCLLRTEKREVDVKDNGTANLQETCSNSFHPETAYCELTDIKFKYEDNQELVHVGLPEANTYKCEICLFTTKHTDDLNRHLATHRTPPKKCIRVETLELTYKCEKCDYKSKRKRHLKNHTFTHRDPSEKTTYKCLVCPHQTRKKYDITRHMLTHKKSPEPAAYKCPACPYETGKKFHLKVHSLIHRDPSEIAMYKCEVCAYQTRRKYRLKDHMVTHMDPSVAPMFQCEVCGFKTKQKFCLRRHMLLHKNSSDAPKYKCDLCEFVSRKKGCLEKHLQIHRDTPQAKMYKCDSCPYAAKRKSRLKDHTLIHKDPSEVAMFKCELCTFETKKKFSLKRHLLIHERSDGTVYTCKSCPFESKNRFDVKRHGLSHKAR